MIPNVRVSPAAIRNRTMPSWSPFRSCSNRNRFMIEFRPRPGTSEWTPGSRDLLFGHLAVLEISVLLIGHRSLNRLGDQRSGAVLHYFADIRVGHRKMRTVELEV